MCLSLLLTVFANMTNYVLDAKSGWISSLTLFLLLCPTAHLPITYPLHHFVIWPIYLEGVGIIQFKNYLL